MPSLICSALKSPSRAQGVTKIARPLLSKPFPEYKGPVAMARHRPAARQLCDTANHRTACACLPCERCKEDPEPRPTKFLPTALPTRLRDGGQAVWAVVAFSPTCPT